MTSSIHSLCHLPCYSNNDQPLYSQAIDLPLDDLRFSLPGDFRGLISSKGQLNARLITSPRIPITSMSRCTVESKSHAHLAPEENICFGFETG